MQNFTPLFSTSSRIPVILAILTILATLGAATGASAQNLLMEIASKADAEAVVSISVENAPNQVRAFSFEVRYDAGSAAYKGHAFGDLLDNFSPKNANAPEPGRLVVGGLDYLTPMGILKGAAGPLVEITFDTSGSDGLGPVQLARLKDGMAGWDANSLNMKKDDASAFDGDADEEDGGGGGGGGCFIRASY